LDQTLRLDRRGEFVERLFVPMATRLLFTGLNLLDRQRAQLAFLFDDRGAAGTVAAKQGIEPASQSPFFCRCHAYSW
jgi:hypothetical protein